VLGSITSLCVGDGGEGDADNVPPQRHNLRRFVFQLIDHAVARYLGADALCDLTAFQVRRSAMARPMPLRPQRRIRSTVTPLRSDATGPKGCNKAVPLRVPGSVVKPNSFAQVVLRALSSSV